MEALKRVEQALAAAVALGDKRTEGPPALAQAIRYAVFPAGARVRPRLAIAVAAACGDDAPRLSVAAACAIELMHCASLVHDDLPCFDDAETRRGQPSVHRAFGERLAVLAGDALIVLAFETLARAASVAPDRLAALVAIVGEAVGMPRGLCAGQAWECEPVIDLESYQRAKTGSLFAAATAAGAAAAGHDPARWALLGDRLGAAYQVADDIRDVAAEPEDIGKPTGRDAALGRPSAVAALGMTGALARFEVLVEEALDAVPPCRGAPMLRTLIVAEAQRLLPVALAPLTRVGRGETVTSGRA